MKARDPGRRAHLAALGIWAVLGVAAGAAWNAMSSHGALGVDLGPRVAYLFTLGAAVTVALVTSLVVAIGPRSSRGFVIAVHVVALALVLTAVDVMAQR